MNHISFSWYYPFFFQIRDCKKDIFYRNSVTILQPRVILHRILNDNRNGSKAFHISQFAVVDPNCDRIIKTFVERSTVTATGASALRFALKWKSIITIISLKLEIAINLFDTDTSKSSVKQFTNDNNYRYNDKKSSYKWRLFKYVL